MTKKNENSLVGVVLVTHIDYGQELLRAGEFILGPQENCATVSVDNSHAPDETITQLKEQVEALDHGRGVIILTDMFGGTPTNLSLSLLGTCKLEVLTGVNLPMLLKVLGSRQLPLEQLAVEAREAGCKGIVAAGEVLRSRTKE